MLDEVAIITRPGSESRRGETDSIAQRLQAYREIFRLEEPAAMDGGDVLLFGKTLYVGVSRRTNRVAIDALGSCVEAFGYRVQAVEVAACLHLKTAVSQVAPDTLLLNPKWVDPGLFPGARIIEVAPEEPTAANALYLPAGVIYPDGHVATRRKLEAAGISLRLLHFSELAKAEAGATCCSLLIN